jgi:hypothetical protein
MTENETLFREVNEHVEDAATRFHDAGEARTTEYFCECANPDCTFQISLTHAEYVGVRADPRQFVVLPRHFTPEVETLVSETERYWLVRKTGEAGEYAEKLDPRSR